MPEKKLSGLLFFPLRHAVIPVTLKRRPLIQRHIPALHFRHFRMGERRHFPAMHRQAKDNIRQRKLSTGDPCPGLLQLRIDDLHAAGPGGNALFDSRRILKTRVLRTSPIKA